MHIPTLSHLPMPFSKLSPGGLEDGGHTFEIVDLYAIDFDPCLKLEDYASFTGGQMPKDVLDQQEKVAQADALAFIHPVFWMGFPAILTGWVQRVFSYGFAYELTQKGWQGEVEGRVPLLKHKKALLISPTFFSEADYKTTGMQDAMEKIMLDWGLRYPGIQQAEHVFFYRVLAVDDKTRKEYLESAYRLGKEF